MTRNTHDLIASGPRLARIAALAGLSLLCACHEGQGASGVSAGASGICAPFKDAATMTNDGAGLDECLHRWAYALASSQEHADIVAQATQTACSGVLSSWNQQTLNQTGGQGSPQATDLVSGQPVDALSAHAQFAQSQALLYVVQARAGHCSPPPARLLSRPAS
jgi:hypothetical protein